MYSVEESNVINHILFGLLGPLSYSTTAWIELYFSLKFKSHSILTFTHRKYSPAPGHLIANFPLAPGTFDNTKNSYFKVTVNVNFFSARPLGICRKILPNIEQEIFADSQAACGLVRAGIELDIVRGSIEWRQSFYSYCTCSKILQNE